MPSLIRKIRDHSTIIDDNWKLLRPTPEESAHAVRLPVGPLLVPIRVWNARRAQLIEREYEHGWPLGVWLAPDEGPETIASDLDDFSVIGVEFPEVSDGRGYTTARLLRDRYGYDGELRAFGDIGRDQLFFLARVGFDTFALRSGDDPKAALGSLRDFSVVHQSASDAAFPLFHRRTA